ncbi:hypothetical protein [Burkholderia sp. JKS000303]|uniref:hypothetical protein n=1 Tax=Burkholderia sp. JKS000303 TaxID=1938747 RepID=UPI000C01B3E1|nr:hypothetical protein [Burkholderia sp. JKS000303]PFH26648.1 hypothetical protein BX604_0344 [Burkholderia sp. JKS000303]
MRAVGDQPAAEVTQGVATAGSIFPQWAQDVTTGASFLGFLLTLYVTWQVGSIRRQYAARGRLPDLTKDLAAKGSELNTLIPSWPQNRNEVVGKIKVTIELLGVARKLLSRSDGGTVSRIHRKFRKTERVTNQDEAWDFYLDLQMAIASLEQIMKNLNWK